MKGLKTQSESPYCPECTDWAVTAQTDYGEIWWCKNCRKPVEEQNPKLFADLPPVNSNLTTEYLKEQKEKIEEAVAIKSELRKEEEDDWTKIELEDPPKTDSDDLLKEFQRLVKEMDKDSSNP